MMDEPELEGTITNFSDSGSQTRVFAVVDVVRKESLVVPVDKLKPVKMAGNTDFGGE